MKKTLPLLLLIGLLLQPFLAYAVTGTDAGAMEVNALASIFSGGIGKAIGLIITVFGIWRMLVSGETAFGFLMLVVGAAITVFPGVFNLAQSIGLPIAHRISGQ